jgi:hypothetical protein
MSVALTPNNCPASSRLIAALTDSIPGISRSLLAAISK